MGRSRERCVWPGCGVWLCVGRRLSGGAVAGLVVPPVGMAPPQAGGRGGVIAASEKVVGRPVKPMPMRRIRSMPTMIGADGGRSTTVNVARRDWRDPVWKWISVGLVTPWQGDLVPSVAKRISFLEGSTCRWSRFAREGDMKDVVAPVSKRAHKRWSLMHRGI